MFLARQDFFEETPSILSFTLYKSVFFFYFLSLEDDEVFLLELLSSGKFKLKPSLMKEEDP